MHTEESRILARQNLTRLGNTAPAGRQTIESMDGVHVCFAPEFCCGIVLITYGPMYEGAIQEYVDFAKKYRKPMLFTAAHHKYNNLATRYNNWIKEGKLPYTKKLMTFDSSMDDYKVSLYKMEYSE
jgi:hypothetical protein